MSNQTEPDATRLPPEARRRLVLIDDIRRVAEEIGYQGRGDTERLGQALDDQGIKPLRANIPSWKGYWGGKWLGVHPYATQKLLMFIKRWLPGLLDHGASGVVQSVPVVKVSCLCSKCGLSGTDECKRRDTALPIQAVTHKPVTQGNVTHDEPVPSSDLGGWTLCHDSRGIYKAVKRKNGRLRSIYIGRDNDPEIVKEKIKAWTERERAKETTSARAQTVDCIRSGSGGIRSNP